MYRFCSVILFAFAEGYNRNITLELKRPRERYNSKIMLPSQCCFMGGGFALDVGLTVYQQKISALER